MTGRPRSARGIDGAIEERIRAGTTPATRVLQDVAAADQARLGETGTLATAARLADDLVGLGPLAPLVGDDAVTDVLVNGDGRVWVDRGRGVQRSVEHDLDGPDAVRRLAVRLAGLAGRRLDEGQPWVDGLLDGGVRLHAILPPLAGDGAHVSLRIPRRMARTLADLAASGMMTLGQRDRLEDIVRARRSFVVTGGTGTGKTTLLAAMLALVPASERVLVVEDVAEIAVDHPHTVRLQARQANVEGVGRVDLVDLVRQALRMRPDRLVVGEVRGAEVRELLLALNTGHDGGCGTLHANRAADVPARFEALGALAGMDAHAVATQLRSAIEWVVHLRRGPGGRVVEAIEPLGGVA